MSVYLECDRCGRPFDGDPARPRGLNWQHTYIVAREARAIGWTGPLGNSAPDGFIGPPPPDLCPTCSPKTVLITTMGYDGKIVTFKSRAEYEVWRQAQEGTPAKLAWDRAIAELAAKRESDASALDSQASQMRLERH